MPITLLTAEITELWWYAGTAIHQLYGSVHVLGLQAWVRNMERRRNLLILPIPVHPIAEPAIVFTNSSHPLSNIINSVNSGGYTLDRNLQEGACVAKPGELIKNATLALLSDIADNAEGVLRFIGEFYPQYQHILIRLDKMELKQISMLCWYKPSQSDRVFVPTFTWLGDESLQGEQIRCDYQIVFGSTQSRTGKEVKYESTDPELRTFLPHLVMSTSVSGWYTNADTICSTAAIHAGLIEGIQRRPFTGIWH